MTTVDTLPPPPNSAPVPTPLPLAERWLLAAADLAQLLGLSVRQVRRLDAAGDLPGRLTGGALGRAVRYQREIVQEWIAAGCPDHQTWEALRRAAQHNGRPKQAGR
jgi:predicted DNA-binding transcriptional regulator AlpA